jgi:hypothetical protein
MISSKVDAAMKNHLFRDRMLWPVCTGDDIIVGNSVSVKLNQSIQREKNGEKRHINAVVFMQLGVFIVHNINTNYINFGI